MELQEEDKYSEGRGTVLLKSFLCIQIKLGPLETSCKLQEFELWRLFFLKYLEQSRGSVTACNKNKHRATVLLFQFLFLINKFVKFPWTNGKVSDLWCFPHFRPIESLFKRNSLITCQKVGSSKIYLLTHILTQVKPEDTWRWNPDVSRNGVSVWAGFGTIEMSCHS